MVPITIDLASSNQFLMNGVEVRLRFDLAHPRKIITSSTANADYKYVLKNVRLHVEKVTPFPSALSSFNKSLLASNSGVPYLHERVVGKLLFFPADILCTLLRTHSVHTCHQNDLHVYD